jgi:hypothetical protein
MNPQEKIDLKKLVTNMPDEYVDNTEGIRALKHSSLIRTDISKIENIKKKHAELRLLNPIEFQNICECECSFLFCKYTDIYNRLIKDEIDLSIMNTALDVLYQIEEGKIDQQEGSVIVGKLFHEIYVDSALRRSENLDKYAENQNESVPKYEGTSISWKEYKSKLTTMK